MPDEDNTKYLISIGIGPVQDFIASARRSRDLWFGSWLLSELSKAAAKSIVEQGGELIFPHAQNNDLKPDSPFNVVNKILAEIKGNPSVVGENVEKAIQQRLGEIRDKAFKNLRNLPNQFFLIDKANLQVSDLVEYFWTATELNPEKYKEDRDKVEKLFSARKSTRDFKPVTSWSGFVPKSSLDGQRESCIHEEAYKDPNKEQLRQFNVREGERLCGVGLLKRHGNRGNDDGFFSTSHVASLPLLERLKKQNESQAVDDYIREISNLTNQIEEKQLLKILGHVPENLTHEVFGSYDGHLLFSERLSEFIENKEQLTKAKKELQKFLERILGKNKEPLPYYALILADGDFMGKAINEQKTKENHKKLSAQLSEFAKEVKDIIEKDKQGSLIYSGGDDVLAFVGLHKVLEYADKLAKDFKDKLTEFKYDNSKSPTLSVGIAVVHHLEPLEDALELVRKAEKQAKQVKDKNALAVVVDKRSGASRIANGTWGTLDKRLKTFINWHRRNAIPDGAAYELRDLAYRLEIPENAIEELKRNLTDAKEKEAKRILGRKKKDFGGSAIDESTLNKLSEFLRQIEETKKDDEESVAILADELIIAKIFADAKDLAGEEIRDE